MSKISITRGDSKTIIITLKNKGATIQFEDGDVLYFTVKKGIDVEDKILQKICSEFNTEGQAIIDILPSDTKHLKYGKYIYDVQYNRHDGTVTTIVIPSDFVITGEVTYE